MGKGISIWLFILISLYGTVSSAQIVSSISASNDTISIGEEIELYYKLTAPKTADIISLDFSSLDSLDSLVPTSSLDTSSIPFYADVEWDAAFMNFDKKNMPYHLVKKSDLGNDYEYRDTFSATFWDIGFFEILHPHIKQDTASMAVRLMELQTPTLLVEAPMDLKNPDTTSIIMPIKDIIITEQSIWQKIKWFVLALFSVLLGLLFYYVTKRKKATEKTVVVVEKPKEPAHVIALTRLSKLAKEEAWKKGQVKSYQSDLTYTIREYLENRYEIRALESTTEEITRALKKANFSSDHETTLKEILQIADLVKFAKAKPAEDINDIFLEKAKQFVLDTKQVIVQSETEAENG